MKPLLVLPPAETVDVQYLLDGVPWVGLKCTTGGHLKFWRCRTAQRWLEVWWGRIGTAGQRQVKELGDIYAASRAKSELIREKYGKGYRDELKEETPAIDWARMSPGDHAQFVQFYGVAAAKAHAAKSQMPSARPGYVQPGSSPEALAHQERAEAKVAKQLRKAAEELLAAEKERQEREERARRAPVSLARFAALVRDEDGEVIE